MTQLKRVREKADQFNVKVEEKGEGYTLYVMVGNTNLYDFEGFPDGHIHDHYYKEGPQTLDTIEGLLDNAINRGFMPMFTVWKSSPAPNQ